jgi:hypothetical protein
MTPIISDTLRRSLRVLDVKEPEPETPEQALRKKLKQEILAELSATLAVPKEAAPVPPPKAKVIRNEGYDPFFELVAAEEEARRNRGHRA